MDGWLDGSIDPGIDESMDESPTGVKRRRMNVQIDSLSFLSEGWPVAKRNDSLIATGC